MNQENLKFQPKNYIVIQDENKNTCIQKYVTQQLIEKITLFT